MSGLGSTWTQGARRSQRNAQSHQHAQNQQHDSEALVASDPYDQAQRWGTGVYDQQFYGQQGVEDAGHATQLYPGTGSNGQWQPGRAHDEPQEPLSQVDLEEIPETASGRPVTSAEQGSGQPGGLFSDIGSKVHEATKKAARKFS
ncbi:hypothetical protein FQN57_005486 [Myotisia sp. PD_48]|nr:hypothetical protein FQN57_005486 [Myotisia sp. PD_48]